MNNKMTIHRALVELKTLNKRINSVVNEGTFIQVNKKSNKKINGMTIEDFKKDVVSASYDRVISLIDRRNAIKSAIVASNAKTKVKIGDYDMTVAEAIERKTSIVFEESLLNRMKAQYNHCVARLNTENGNLPTMFEKYLQTFGGKEAMQPEVVEEHRKNYYGANECELVDPLQLEKKIRTFETEITSFLNDVDATLSESNATTFIEF